MNKIDNLYDTIDISEYDETRRLVRNTYVRVSSDSSKYLQYPQWTGRRDRRGIPVYTFEVAPLNSKRMAAYEKSASKSTLKSTPKSGDTSPKLLRLFALYENLLNFTFPLCSGIPDRPYAETPVSQSNNIVDIAGVGLKQFWNLRQHMQDASQLATAHYPETLDRIFVSPPVTAPPSMLLLLTTSARSLVRRLSSQQSGPGSKDGSTPSPLARSSFCPSRT